MHIDESHTNPYLNPGRKLRNSQYTLIKLCLQNICWTNSKMKVTPVFWHWLKPLPWTHLNSRYFLLDVGYSIVNPYIIIHFHWPNISGKYVLSKSHNIGHHDNSSRTRAAKGGGNTFMGHRRRCWLAAQSAETSGKGWQVKGARNTHVEGASYQERRWGSSAR